MEKLSLNDLQDRNDWEEAVIVFTAGSRGYKEMYPEPERSYKISSGNKFFIRGLSSTSLYGDRLDGKDNMVELTQYIYSGALSEDYCYITK